MKHPSSGKIPVLIVDEDRHALEAIQSCFPAPQYHCVTAPSAEAALDQLEQSQFQVVVCAIRLSGAGSLELLRRGLSSNPQAAFLMTASSLDWDVAIQAMKAGASDCLRKPFQREELISCVESALVRKRSKIEGEMFQLMLAETLEERTEHLQNALHLMGEIQQSTVEMLVTALDAREHQKNQHSLRVQTFCLLLAEKCGYSSTLMKQLGLGALLHDIGKIVIPDAILLKPDRLTPEEFRIAQRHSLFGYQVLSRIPHLQQAASVALFHHERVDGKGYPMMLLGDSIPLAARIFAVADALDVITAGRPYCPPRTMEEARAEIQHCAGSQFDREVVEIFLGIREEEWVLAREKVAARMAYAMPLFSPKTSFQNIPF